MEGWGAFCRAYNHQVESGREDGVVPGRAARRAARDALIVELRLRGFSFQEIADRAGCSVGTAHRVATEQAQRSPGE